MIFALFLCTALTICTSTHARGNNFEYSLQRKPVIFIASPQSQDFFSQDDLVLNCSVRLWSKSTVLLQWRHNGQLIINDFDEENRISIHSFTQDEDKIMRSELQINNVSMSDAGQYECVALDGVDKNGKAAMITASKSAEVHVLEYNSRYSSGTTEIIKNYGEYVLLMCDVINSGASNRVTWTKNGLIIPTSDSSILLRNGTLLIYNLTEEDKGIYHCFSTLAGYQLDGATYNLSLNDNAADMGTTVLVDPADFLVSRQDMFSITCCLLGLDFMHYELTLTRINKANNITEVLWSYNSTRYCNVISIQEMELGTYEYRCDVAQSVLYSTAITVKVEDPPIMLDSLRLRDKTTSSFEIFVNLECPLLSGSNLTFKWYKNGLDITVSSNSSTGRLIYDSERDDTGAVGVYQCFAKNNVGSDYATIRQVEIGFANPVENFTCRAVDNVNSLPKVILSWDTPDFNTTLIQSYVVTFESDIFTTNSTFYEINLEADQLSADFSVYVERLGFITSKDGVEDFCQIANTLERRYDPTNARAAEVICPTNRSPGSILWDNPMVPPGRGLSLPLHSYHIQCRCLYKETVTQCGDFKPSGSDNIEIPSFTFPVESQPTGSLCIVGGDYIFTTREFSPLTIPPEICEQNSDDINASHVNVFCEDSLATIVLLNSHSHPTVHVEGNCLLADISTTIYMNETLSSNKTKININHTFPEIIACSFIASNLNVDDTKMEGIQCVMNQFVSVRQLTVDMTFPETELVNSSEQSIVSAIVQTFVVILLVSSISLLITLLVCLRRKQKIRRKKMWHKAVQTVAEDTEFKEERYDDQVFPNKTIPDDAVSNVTVCENLCSENQSVMEMRGNFLFARLLYDSERFCSKNEHDISSSIVHDLPEGDRLWHYTQQTSINPKNNSNGSNCYSSGYETESDAYQESREYFIAREVDHV